MGLNTLLGQVRWNCDISSAVQAGHFSLCGLLLRLRQLYKWDQGLNPWQEPDPPAVLDWIEAKEQAWNDLEESDWQPLHWDGQAFAPFAVEELNAALLSRELAYGAGLSRGLAPTCFLGELNELRRLDGLTIIVLGRELARDLDASPALRQGNLIYARREAMAFYLWDRLSDPVQLKNAYLQVALQTYRLPLRSLLAQPERFQAGFAAFLAAELEAAIHHEVGEARETALQEALPNVLTLFPQTRIELWARALKDVLADVNDWGRLAFIIRERHLASLAVLLAWRPGLYALLLPELEATFHRVVASQDWEALESARFTAQARLRQTAADLEGLLAGYDPDHLQPLRSTLERRFLAPLGL
jgi:hypothetical protein